MTEGLKNRRQFLKSAVAAPVIPLLASMARGDTTPRADGISLGVEGLPPLVDPGFYVILGERKSGRSRLLRHFAEHCNARYYNFIFENAGPYREFSRIQPKGPDTVTFIDGDQLGYTDYWVFDRWAKQHQTFIVGMMLLGRSRGVKDFPPFSYMEIDRGHLSYNYKERDRVSGAVGGLIDVRHIIHGN